MDSKEYGMSKFKSKEDIEHFIMLNIPFAIIPIKKAKTMMVSPFSSNHGKKTIIKALSSKLWQYLNETATEK